MTRILFALSLGFAGLIFAAQARAGTPLQCDARPKVLHTLNQTYGETRRGVGLAANNTVMEVFANETSGTWSVTVTLPDGRTCLMASGQAFEAVTEGLPAKGDPA